jgi:hypothetical protein
MRTELHGDLKSHSSLGCWQRKKRYDPESIQLIAYRTGQEKGLTRHKMIEYRLDFFISSPFWFVS